MKREQIKRDIEVTKELITRLQDTLVSERADIEKVEHAVKSAEAALTEARRREHSTYSMLDVQKDKLNRLYEDFYATVKEI